jgi:hypothetical protein
MLKIDGDIKIDNSIFYISDLMSFLYLIPNYIYDKHKNVTILPLAIMAHKDVNWRKPYVSGFKGLNRGDC